MPYKFPTRLNKAIAESLIKQVDNFLFDCDGVIWNWPKAIDGSVELINKLKHLGKKCFFVTNNSTKTRAMVLDLVKSIGVKDTSIDDIVCTAWVLGGYLNSIKYTDKVYVVGSEAIGKELDNANIRHTGIGPTSHIPDPSKFDYQNSLKLDPEVKCVTVGFDVHINYPKLVMATSYAYKNGNCLFVATNDDAQFPTGEEKRITIPGTGTFVNALRTSIGREPVILGKPHRTMWDVLGKVHKLDPAKSCMIGDRLDTDIAFAANCSLGFSMAVLSGVSTEEEILSHSNILNEPNFLENEKAKLIPDFYANSLRDFEAFIRDI